MVKSTKVETDNKVLFIMRSVIVFSYVELEAELEKLTELRVEGVSPASASLRVGIFSGVPVSVVKLLLNQSREIHFIYSRIPINLSY